jgi:sugar phosphate isomerase/epimerase
MKSKIGGSIYCKRNIESELHNLKSVGYDFAELDLGQPIEPNKIFANEIKKVKNIIPILVGHLPEIDFKEEEIERCKKFIEILSNQNVNLFVIHLFSRNLTTDGNIDLKIRGLKELTDFAKNNNSILALENTEEDVGTLKTVFNKISEISFCLDIGHANLFAKENRSINLIKNFGKILKHIHLHDNVGGDAEKFDLHLPIGAGRINFVPIFDKLKEIKYSGNITLEVYNPDKEYRKISIERARKLICVH